MVDENGQYKVKSELYNVGVPDSTSGGAADPEQIWRITGKPVDGCLMRVQLSARALEERRLAQAGRDHLARASNM